ncbi:alpha/beta fold hydrolase [Celeribacter ethanolicus]|uniref:alpha/beta fold hydrolase n=1 Tax=Celeribacter ethanolicus TaxID=1758178 RepID=UPI001EE4B27A|nr:alpha/beta fold hydrolase [Celeribacter ethanolicus]
MTITIMIIPEAVTMTDPSVLLIHGSAHGAWCWRDLLAELHARGLKARALDLPSHGADRTPYDEIGLDSYRDAILADMRRAAQDHPVLGLIEKTEDGRAFRFKPEAGVEALCHDCSEEVKTYVRDHIGPQAIRPQETPLRVTPASTARPRHYVICENDRVIPPAEQRKMCADWPASTVHSLSSGHSPYFAQPARLADTLAHILHRSG